MNSKQPEATILEATNGDELSNERDVRRATEPHQRDWWRPASRRYTSTGYVRDKQR